MGKNNDSLSEIILKYSSETKNKKIRNGLNHIVKKL